ncbi:uncharacterized protein LOC122363287 [Amphibalanus amphitrite]|uniref:uncharacterized protein LOC122363287 n=1 Tax=Amphibalanus amphitrite TaxID=1232801 RepID=UPI001C9194A5|nr:uncharacterized protein LOC122363287 [Amphibalanus amphitrite]
MGTRCSTVTVLLALWLGLVVAAAARRLSIEYDAVPIDRASEDLVEYVEEPVYGYQRTPEVSDSEFVSYQTRFDRPTRVYRLGRRIQKPVKRYLGVEIPDEIAQRTAGGGGALIDKLKQQMQTSGK